MHDRYPSEEKSVTARLLCVTDRDYKPTEGSVAAVADAVRRGDDLRRFSTYNMKGTGLVEETMTLQTTWVFDDGNVGGLQTIRHPVDAAAGISMQPSLALWIFSVSSRQRSAFVPLNGKPMANATGPWVQVDNDPFGLVEEGFVPGQYKWWARGGWEQICAHDEDGNPTMGDWQVLMEAARDGCTLKVGIENLWSYLAPPGETSPEHEVFMECTTDFAHLDEKLFGSLTQPTFFLQPRVPLEFTGENFAPGWLVVRSDGKAQRQSLDPSRMEWEKTWARYATRWFAR